MLKIRSATADDMEAIAQLYSHYVRHSAATFELDPPDAVEMERRWTSIVVLGLPFLAAEMDGVIVGYAYAGRYRPRPAYEFTVEDSIYIDPRATGQGLGKRLLSALMAACEPAQSRQMIAVIGDSSNTASVALHTSLGFRHVGVLREVGFKFGKWHDTILMQRALYDLPQR
jgi:L-amino acid N-acyltransferase YncA